MLWVFTTPPITIAVAAVFSVGASAWFARAYRPAADGASRSHEEARAQLTERIEALSRDRALQDQILGAMDEAVVLVEGDEVAYANPAAEHLLGVGPGRRPPPAVSIEPGEGVTEFAVHHPTERTLRAATADLPDGRRMIVAQDVTEARRIDRIRRDFVANASHELKTPIAAILATAETLEGAIEGDPESARRFASTLVKEATRLSHLIQDLLDLARLDQPQPDMQPTEWSALVAAVLEEVTPVAEAKCIRLTAQIDGTVIVHGRAQDLQLLARNLLDNAITYTPAGGAVEVRLRTADGSGVLAVTDTGIGIPAKDLPRIFERFYRVDRARARETGGTGLGLSIVRHVAESHGGTVTAESTLGEGSTFLVRLPMMGL